MEWPIKDEVSLFFSSEGLVVVAPLPDGAYRVVATLENAPEIPGIGDIQRILERRGPTAPCRISAIGWASRFRVQHRLADSYRSGPFLLMGDAAHVHSPAGGQGMNTGLVDAMVLGEALTRVVRDGEPDTLLDEYSRSRRAAAHEVLALASRLTRMATIHSATGRQMRNLVLSILNRAPLFKRKLSLGLSGLARRRFSVLPPACRADKVVPSNLAIQRVPLMRRMASPM
jgi:2-polyprenyl-6-methoxyphenol hydroxylase-like FAD-dependent oxidoreductase